MPLLPLFAVTCKLQRRDGPKVLGLLAAAQVLIVAPDAESISRKLMGPFWLHQVPDHYVHYSRAGIAAIFSRAGFHIARTFLPVKRVSLAMARNHLRLLARAPAAAGVGGRDGVRVWFNIGEMGLLLERDDS